MATDEDKYTKLLSKLSVSLSQGGGLFLVGALNQKCFKVGAKSFYSLAVDADFVKKAVGKTGFTNVKMEIHNFKDANESSKGCNLGEYFLLSATKA